MSRRDIITAVPVAFAADGALDLEGSREILRFVAQSGNEGAFVLGTTGEFPALSYEERVALTRASVEELGSSMRVIVHVGAPSLYEVLRLIASVREAGATEIAVITPYYLAASDEGLYEFYQQVSAASEGLDVYVYVFRARTGNFVSAELMARLAQLPNIVGAKISDEPLSQIAAYRAVVADEFLLYTGSDRDLATAAEVGAQGVVSGISSVLPKPFRALRDAAESGDANRIADAQVGVDAAVDAIRGDMARMKAAYALLGVAAGTVRMAIDAPDADGLAEVENAVRTLS
ncbi:dihydrodipicolinate synthase family protein [Microbacterium capsulatum]|uniref:Dihydrodipicolinate synthase family protein n=1 Tax=Microbacterium capsulatum TaxID=3041921 RepID=A0ABU0XEF8_9MICO|nr:dihydrodipicolinate synthase family protein [Microbacterium sp. ASV81]MDQ4213492.1 dihydrodipicolinate synthase family protein [Microbacterium sp. ASV81]